MKSVSDDKSGTDYASLLRFELNEMGLIYQDPSLKSYQKDVEQKLLEEEFDIRFSEKDNIQRKLLKLDKKGLERRYQTGMLTSEEYRSGIELARETDEIFVPEADRKYGGLSSGLPEFLRSDDATLGLTGEFPTKYTGIKWKTVMETAMVLSAAVAGGIVLNKYSADKKFANDVDSGIAKVKMQITGAAGFFGDFFKSAPPVIDNPVPANTSDAAAPQVSKTPLPHQFTPDLKVFGSPEYKKKVQDSLDELNKTPDSFRINGMTAYEYATKYMEELHEGNETDAPAGSMMYNVYMPKELISASNLIHIPRHIEQVMVNQTFKDEMKKWESGVEGKDAKNKEGSLFMEYDAIYLQVSWEKARYNLTKEQKKNIFLSYMKQYTKDSRYLEEELIKN